MSGQSAQEQHNTPQPNMLPLNTPLQPNFNPNNSFGHPQQQQLQNRQKYTIRNVVSTMAIIAGILLFFPNIAFIACSSFVNFEEYTTYGLISFIAGIALSPFLFTFGCLLANKDNVKFGIALIVLFSLCIIYFIVSTIFENFASIFWIVYHSTATALAVIYTKTQSKNNSNN